MQELWRSLRFAVTGFAVFGVLYSLVVLGIGQAIFPQQADGSLVLRGGRVVGSYLIGQDVTSAGLFHGRPSATLNPQTGRAQPYAADNSSGSNLGPSNPALLAEVRRNIAAVRSLTLTAHPPANLVESSASGLDPEITLRAALAETPGIARHTGISPARLRALVLGQVEQPLLGLYGPQRVNVLRLNLALLRLLGRRP